MNPREIFTNNLDSIDNTTTLAISQTESTNGERVFFLQSIVSKSQVKISLLVLATRYTPAHLLPCGDGGATARFLLHFSHRIALLQYVADDVPEEGGPGQG